MCFLSGGEADSDIEMKRSWEFSRLDHGALAPKYVPQVLISSVEVEDVDLVDCSITPTVGFVRQLLRMIGARSCSK